MISGVFRRGYSRFARSTAGSVALAGDFDTLIAATSLAAGHALLVTRNPSDFAASRIWRWKATKAQFPKINTVLVVSLQSGSSGNCYYVEARGVRLVVDAGISGVQAGQRLARHGFDIRKADGLLISHNHADHSRSMGIFHRKSEFRSLRRPRRSRRMGLISRWA